MATVGLTGDVNNSMFLRGTYPGGRDYGMLPAAATDFSMRNNYAGELGGLNQDYARARMAMAPPGASNAPARAVAPAARSGNGNGSVGKQPAMWFLGLAVTFIIVAWAARRFAPDGESFAIVKPNLINGVFLTLWIVLILVFLKQVAIRVEKVPLVSHLAKLVLSA